MFWRVPQRWTWREWTLLKEALEQGIVEDLKNEVEVEGETDTEENSGSEVSGEGESDTGFITEDEEQEAWWAEEQEIFSQGQ